MTTPDAIIDLNSYDELRAWAARAATLPGVSVEPVCQRTGSRKLADGSYGPSERTYYVTVTVDRDPRSRRECSDPSIDPVVFVAGLRQKLAAWRRENSRTRRVIADADRW